MITDRRIRRTRKSLHEALLALLLEKNYDSITVQEILDRADVGRSTFYAHFDTKHELLVSEMQELRLTLEAALDGVPASAARHNKILAFSRAMFEHAYSYRKVYRAIVRTQAWPMVSGRLQSLIEELVARECKKEIAELRWPKSDIPVDLFVHYLTTTLFMVMTWWMDHGSRLTAAQIDDVFRSLVRPTLQSVLA